jgi:hypothetical protein
LAAAVTKNKVLSIITRIQGKSSRNRRIASPRNARNGRKARTSWPAEIPIPATTRMVLGTVLKLVAEATLFGVSEQFMLSQTEFIPFVPSRQARLV